MGPCSKLGSTRGCVVGGPKQRGCPFPALLPGSQSKPEVKGEGSLHASPTSFTCFTGSSAGSATQDGSKFNQWTSCACCAPYRGSTRPWIARSRSLGLRLARHHQPGGGQIVLLRAPRHPRRLGRLGRIREPRMQRRGEKGLSREQEKGSTNPKTESKTRASRERRRGAMAPEEMQATKRLLAQHIHTTKRLVFASFAHQCPTGVVRQQTGGVVGVDKCCVSSWPSPVATGLKSGSATWPLDFPHESFE